jgi:hypothetical protein
VPLLLLLLLLLLLQAPLALALSEPEIDWAAPRPPDWIMGGAWGSQRTILFSGWRLDTL